MSTTTEAAEKRVLIATDVLKLLADEAIEAACGSYIRLVKPRGATKWDDAREVLQKAIASDLHCSVCAKGAMVVAHCLRFNGVDARDAGLNASWNDRSWDVMKEYADWNFLRHVEMAFEVSGEWRCQYPEARERLIAICQNIVRNGGEFNSDEVTTPA